jgi:hypothetical protein
MIGPRHYWFRDVGLTLDLELSKDGDVTMDQHCSKDLGSWNELTLMGNERWGNQQSCRGIPCQRHQEH